MTIKKKYPIVDFGVSKYATYHYNDLKGNTYSTDRLKEIAKNYEVFDLPLAGLDLSYEIWQGANIRELAMHVYRVKFSNLNDPIILDWNGSIADGRHRIIKAIIEEKQTIKAVRLDYVLTPCNANKMEQEE